MPSPALPRRQWLSTLAAASLIPTTSPSRARAAEAESFLPQRHPLLITNNPVIAAARDAGLAVLQPSQADLHKGLTIHHESQVFDFYGFAPRAALDVERMTAAIQAGAAPQELDDLSEELSMLGALHQPAERREFAEAFACSGVTALFQNAGEESQDPLRLLKRLARFTHLGDNLREILVRATRMI